MKHRAKRRTVATSPQPASEELYQAIFEQAADGIFIATPQGRYVEVNRRGGEMLGYSREEVLRLSWHDLIPIEDLANDPLPLDDLRAGKTVVKERRMRCKDGRLLSVEISGRMRSNGNLLGIVRDITERKRAAEALRESERQYHLLFYEMLSGFALHEIMCDPTGKPVDYRFLAVNSAFEKLTGLRSQEIIGKTVREVIPGIEPYWIERYGRVALTGAPVQFEDYAGGLGKILQGTLLLS